MKVLFAASEVSPIVKIGGLGDVAGALPKALEKLGVTVHVIVPFYNLVDRHKIKFIKQFSLEVPFANATHDVAVYKTKLPGSNVDVLLLEEPTYLSKGGSDAFTSLKDEMERFAFFSRAVVEYIKAEFNTYDLVHCNDWHTGLITHLLEDEIGEERPATLFTIHNVAYQGVGGLDLVREVGLSVADHQILEWDLEDGNVNFMLEGIASSDFVNTVSPSYSKELLFKDVGGVMSDILKSRKARFKGILNGIDVVSYNPTTDPAIKFRFDHKSWAIGKRQNKELLQKELGLSVKNKPLLALVSRLDIKQKGLDIVSDAMKEILDLDLQFVILGKGDKTYEEALKKLATLRKYHGKLSVSLGFDEGLARRIYAGADMFLMPSRTEPCGLAQMIAMRYGALPIVHAVGGLKDTVRDGVTGFTFNVFSGPALSKTVSKAYRLWMSKKWETMVQKAMKKDFSWATSAYDYKELYSQVVSLRK